MWERDRQIEGEREELRHLFSDYSRLLATPDEERGWNAFRSRCAIGAAACGGERANSRWGVSKGGGRRGFTNGPDGAHAMCTRCPVPFDVRTGHGLCEGKAWSLNVCGGGGVSKWEEM